MNKSQTGYDKYRANRPFNKILEEKTKDYWKTNRNPDLDPKDPQAAYATYLPATSSNFVNYCQKQHLAEFGVKSSGFTPGSRLAKAFDPNGDELNFYQRDSGAFYYGAGLYSTGHAVLDLEKSLEKESFIHRRDPEVTMLGDSGGFQWATGTWKTDWNSDDDINKIRHRVLKWLEQTADYSMILDMPTSATTRNPDFETIRKNMHQRYNPGSLGYSGAQACLDFTLENAEYFIKHRTPGKTKFLNVLQGRTPEEADWWFDAVKHLPFEGWALAGANNIDFYMILRRVIALRDQKLIGKDRPWLHVLGVSKLGSACGLTHIQRLLRQQIDETLTISYDSSSPFLSTANGQIYTGSTISRKRYGLIASKAVDDQTLTNDTRKLKEWIQLEYQHSTDEHTTWISRNVDINEICFKDENSGFSSSWDTISYIMLMHHNVEMLIKSIQKACRIYDGTDPDTITHKDGIFEITEKIITPGLEHFKEVVEEVFASETPFDVLDGEKAFLQGHNKNNPYGSINGAQAGKKNSDAGWINFEDR